MTEQESSLRLQQRRLVNRLFYGFMALLFRRFILNVFRLQPVDAGKVPRSGPGLILANHVCLFDPVWIYAMLRRPVYFAATEDLFRQPLVGKVIRWFGGFPKRKAAADLGAMRRIFQLAAKDQLIGIFPEGVRTWDGLNTPIVPGIVRLIQKLKVPVYVCRLEGAYLSYPRWAKWWRKLPVRGVFTKLYDPDTIPEDEGKVFDDITACIRNPDYDLPALPPARTRSGLAVNLTRLLYRCPNCGTLEGLKVTRPYSSNRVECSSCFSSWIVDLSCRVAVADEQGKPEDDWLPLHSVYARVRSMPLHPIQTGLRLGLEEGERLYMISRPRFLMKQERFPVLSVLAFGRAFLTDRRLLFRSRLGVRFSAPLSRIEALSVDPGDKLHFSYEGKLHRIPFRNESALKWYDMIHRLKGDA